MVDSHVEGVVCEFNVEVREYVSCSVAENSLNNFDVFEVSEVVCETAIWHGHFADISPFIFRISSSKLARVKSYISVSVGKQVFECWF